MRGGFGFEGRLALPRSVNYLRLPSIPFPDLWTPVEESCANKSLNSRQK